eukprot:TRINITY_DN457_c0_g1_i1.p1 TRINITY_DN457_c0_g1~~TRINITY_DN457_c0_g1_i1.p1  ORF type:complete len:313 (-),score=101.77 TRINITY_DN457_c0_g1_i1:74-1012(-)
MGKLIAGSNTTNADFIVDFENAKPSDEERDLHTQLSQVLDKGPVILDKLFKYSGCEEYIRKAITTPGPETEEAAWNAVLPAVDQLQEFFDYAMELEVLFPKLLVALCKDNGKASLQNQQALAKQMADVFDFVLRFDDAKMTNPAIQNDFSYYRRTLNRMKISRKEMNIKIRDELANRMSLFFAYPTPMMKVIGDTTTKFLSTDTSLPRENVTSALAMMANVCQGMVSNRKFSSDNTNIFCLRAMTGAIILFDHIDAQGAFARKSPINIKASVNLLKTYTTSPTDGLLNAIRFTTVHLNDPQTPNAIKQLLNS